MNELQVGELLLDLALLFALTYLLAGLLERRRIPGILAALFIAMAAPLAWQTSPRSSEAKVS